MRACAKRVYISIHFRVAVIFDNLLHRTRIITSHYAHSHTHTWYARTTHKRTHTHVARRRASIGRRRDKIGKSVWHVRAELCIVYFHIIIVKPARRAFARDDLVFSERFRVVHMRRLLLHPTTYDGCYYYYYYDTPTDRR